MSDSCSGVQVSDVDIHTELWRSAAHQAALLRLSSTRPAPVDRLRADATWQRGHRDPSQWSEEDDVQSGAGQ